MMQCVSINSKYVQINFYLTTSYMYELIFLNLFFFGSYTFQYRCNDLLCNDVPEIGSSDTRTDQLELLPDNMISDGRRECTLVATQVTDCLISFP